MEKYVHTVKYYETDRMGFTHHSNYVRWMEEARVAFMDQVVCEAASEHCFLGADGKFVRLNKEYPEFYQLLCDLAEEDN